MILALALVATGCANLGGADTSSAPQLGLDAPLPTEVPAGTKIIVGDPVTQKALELSGQIDKVSSFVEWANLSGGPQTSEAFRAGALDVGSVAEIPPIHATWTGLDVKIVASKFRQDAINHPVYELGVAPGANVKTLTDLRGKKIAYSPGQAQGALVLKVLQKAGLTKEDVTLVELPSTGDVYLNALSSKQVDVAPIGGVSIKRYLTKYGPDGGTTILHGLRDDPGHLYALTSSIEDAGKAAALAKLVVAWAEATRWVDEHPAEWIAGYYVKDQGLSEEDGAWLVKRAGHPEVPADLTPVYARHQATIDLLAAETKNPVIKAEDLYDPRFVPLAATAFAAGEKKS
ncbi:MAG: ABC transporter substrate-binding protein [Propionibacteriaceae bacterium]